RLLRIVDVHTVHRRVNDVIAARAEVDARVSAREVALRVRQRPVAFERAADRAAVRPELLHAELSQLVTTDDAQTKRHRSHPSAWGAVVATRILCRRVG